MEVEGTTSNDQINNDPLKKSMPNSETTPDPASAASGGFDCNICLDSAADPVVTLCGHLYCWQCIYKWLQVENSSMQNCPVCKASLSLNSLVPLYGRGQSTKPAHRASDIPPRPNHFRAQTEENSTEAVHRQRHHHHYHVHHHYPYNNGAGSGEFITAPSSPLMGATSRGLSWMAIAVLSWMFGNQSEFGRTGSYYLSGVTEGSPGTRRQVKEVERSLHQIWLFLSCCALLCLILF